MKFTAMHTPQLHLTSDHKRLRRTARSHNSVSESDLRASTIVRDRSGAKLLTAVVALLAMSSPSVALSSDDPDEGYILQSSRWTANRVPVCWENGSAATATEQGWVRDRVTTTWDAASAVAFTGWGNCNASTTSGIRIRIADAGPHVVALGKNLNNVANGMLLNFTFSAWGASCSSSPQVRRSCIESIALHEFGHALGIAHEHNRPDTDRSLCTDAPQGTNGDVMIGPWDRDSIMNYCFNASYRNALSATDRATINSMYPSDLVDFNGDGRTDVALIGGPGWTRVPVALSHSQSSTLTGGSFTVVNGGVGSFSDWASGSNAQPLAGDFNNDGRTDVALVGGTGWNTLPMAFSTGTGTFTVTNLPIAGFAGWASETGAKVVRGDFNGDGRADLALVGGVSWTTVPVALSNGNGSFAVTNLPVGAFASWAAGSAVKPIAADFDGDGRTDIALVRSSMLSTLPVAFSNGDGSFRVTNLPITAFGYWASASEVEVHAGDFNADGRADLALSGVAWASIPIAFSNGTGAFNVTNNYAGDFSAWARVPGAIVRAADFTGDGRTDLAVTGGAGWKTMPVAQSLGDGTWRVSNRAVDGFADWSGVAGVSLILGDFDRSGTFDLGLTGGAGWTTLPSALSATPTSSPVLAPFGSFLVYNLPAHFFAALASQAGVKVITQK